MAVNEAPLLSVSLTASYGGKSSVLRDLSLQLRRKEILGLAGSSGSGKSTLAMAIMGLLPRSCQLTGHVHFNGKDLLHMSKSKLRRVRGREIALVLQSPSAALNPVLRIRTQLREAWCAHRPVDGTENIRATLRAVNLPDNDEFLRRYPSQLSVGQGQRVLIAMALLHQPALIIADEPTSALDAITQHGILNLLRQCNESLGTTILLISHDLRALESVCHRVAILESGQIVECGSVETLAHNPQHSFTRALTQAAGRV
jgi:ABC-type dipeptide/oligopeptide/nickel transport system ATPase component